MVKLKGPGLAQQASGSLGSELIFSTWKGRAYLKKKTAPKQPQTGRQVAMRTMMRFLASEWNAISSAHKATWLDLADKTKISPFNAYQAENLARWRNLQAPSQIYPPTEAADQAELSVLTCFGECRHVRIRMRIQAPLADAWTAFVFHKLGAYPPAAWQNLVHVEMMNDAPYHYWTQTPLPPGQHFYRFTVGSNDGKVDWTITFTHSCWVT